MKDAWKYIIPIVVIIAMAIASANLDNPVANYSPSFSKDHSRSYGSKVVYDLIEDLFEGEFTTLRTPTYNVFTDSFFSEQSVYVVFNTSYEPDPFDIDYLTDFVEEGNYVFIAAQYFSEVLLDTLGGLETNPSFGLYQPHDSSAPYFMQKNLNPDTLGAYDFSRPNTRSYFTNVPPNAQVISKISPFRDSIPAKANLVYIPYGKGGFMMAATPYILTNYEVLNGENHDYLAKAFSHFPKEANILWDEYYKVEYLQNISRSRSGGGLYGYIRSQPGLSAAWTLFILSIMLYVFSEVKRKQRTVPIITPHPNATLEFTQTIGQLYYSRQDHKSIASKKIKVWLEYVRSHYYLKTTQLDAEFVEKLSAKSGLEIGALKNIVNLIARVRRQEHTSEETLIDLSVLIESFYEKSAR